MPQDITYGLDTVESVWTWAIAYADLRGIYALYETFRRFQEQQTGAGRVPSPKQAWEDLANSVLFDGQNRVNESMARIDQNKRKLFFDVKKVNRMEPGVIGSI